MRTLLLLVTTLLMSGCLPWLKPNVEEHYIYVTKYRTVSNEYLQYCPIVEPPPIEKYMSSTPKERIDQWIDVYSEQVHKTRLRNIKMDELIELNDHLDKEYNEKISQDNFDDTLSN